MSFFLCIKAREVISVIQMGLVTQWIPNAIILRCLNVRKKGGVNTMLPSWPNTASAKCVIPKINGSESYIADRRLSFAHTGHQQAKNLCMDLPYICPNRSVSLIDLLLDWNTLESVLLVLCGLKYVSSFVAGLWGGTVSIDNREFGQYDFSRRPDLFVQLLTF